MKKIDWKKVQSLVLTYTIPTIPLATAAFSLKAPTAVKILSFVSGVLVVIRRETNPNDAFTINLLKVAQEQVDTELAKKSTKKA